LHNLIFLCNSGKPYYDGFFLRLELRDLLRLLARSLDPEFHLVAFRNFGSGFMPSASPAGCRCIAASFDDGSAEGSRSVVEVARMSRPSRDEDPAGAAGRRAQHHQSGGYIQRRTRER